MTRFLILLLLSLTGLASPAWAQLAFSLRTGDTAAGTQSMPIDSNNCANAGPRAMYVGGIITNSGGTTVTNIDASMSGLGSGFFLAGGQPASQSIGSLGPGESTGVYWFVGYGCTVNATSSPAILITSSAATVSSTVTMTARSAISANAGGNVLSSTLGPGAVVGQTIYFDTSYDFGGSAANDEFFLQPSGGQNFNAACFRLVGTLITGSNISPITAGTANRLYFLQTVKQAGNGYFANVRYFFEYQCAGASTTARPYAVQTSGNTNIKYTGNFDGSGSVSISFPGAANPFTISKTADQSSAPGGVLTTLKYTVTITNPSAYDSRISQIVDTLPSGATFVALDAASDVTSANSSSVPAAGASGTLIFAGKQDQSYLIPAGGSVSLVYSVSMPETEGTYSNSAQGYFGSATTAVASFGFTVSAPLPLTVVKSSVADWDPLNEMTNPKLIPGSQANYTITVANPNAYTVTADSISIVDATPSGLQLFVSDLQSGSGPFLFQDGGSPSGLTFSYSGLGSQTDDVDFSNDGGVTWTYVPVMNGNGSDPNVTHVRIRPKGSMASGSSFMLQFAYRLE